MNGYVSGGALCGICGKLQWTKKKVARSVIRRMLITNPEGRLRNGAPLRVYASCDKLGYHVGHTKATGRPNLNDPRINWVPNTALA